MEQYSNKYKTSELPMQQGNEKIKENLLISKYFITATSPMVIILIKQSKSELRQNE